MPLTAAQIVTDACQIAKCPGYTAQGGRALNLTLLDLVMHRNLKVNLETSFVSVPANSSGPFNLESNYLRTYDMFFLVAGEPYFLEPCSLREIDAELQNLGLASYPYEWASDLSNVPTTGFGLFYIYPQSNNAITLTHRYYLRQTEITTPETSAVVPWFEDQDYLIQATAMRLMRITDDDRFGAFEAGCEALLRKHLMTEGDEQQVVKSVVLDPRRFRIKGNLKSTKNDPW
jgi:hypothetical protein